MDSSTSSNSSLISSKSDAVVIQAPPKDSFNYSYWVFVVLGIVLILPWNALIQSLGFLDSKYPGKDINFMVSTVANAPIFIAQILMLIFYRYVNLKTFILLSLVFMSLLCVAIPLVSNYWNEYIVIMVILTLFWFFDGILQSTSYGYTGPFPPRVIGALSNGWGLSGVIIGIWRAISLVVFPIKNGDKEDTNLFYGATLYFSLASFWCLIWVVMFVIMSKTDYHKYYKLQHSWKNERSQKPSLDSQNQGILRNTIDTDMYIYSMLIKFYNYLIKIFLSFFLLIMKNI